MNGLRFRPGPASLRFAGLLAVTCAALLATTLRHANATPEGSVTYAVSQSPATGAVVQVGSQVSFSVDVTSAPGSFAGPVHFDLRKPAGTAFAGYGSQAGNLITSCSDNVPAAGYVRCTLANGNSIVAGALDTGGTEIVLSFSADSTAGGALADLASVWSDGGTGFRNAGDAPDNIGGGDTLDGSVGAVTVANIGGAGANITLSTSSPDAWTYEGRVSSVTLAFNTGLALGATLQPIDATVANGDIVSGSVSCPGGTGSGAIIGSVARCSGSTVTDGSFMTFQVRARDTAAGDDISVVISAVSLGLTYAEAAASFPGSAQMSIVVYEVGLETTGGPAWVVGTPVSVCTASVGFDAANDSAAGTAQDPARSFGTSTLSLVAPLAAGDFTVSGPSGGIAFTYLDGSQCGASQSGVQFTPAAAGGYTVTAYYNGDTSSAGAQVATRGSNTLSLSTQAANGVPTVSILSPSNVTMGSPSFTLTVTGSNFVNGSVVRWNGSDRSTTFLSSGQIQATISSGDVAAAGTANVTVYSPPPGGGTSNTLNFTINGTPNGAPLISSLSPSSANAGTPGFTITVYGSGFVSGAIVRWNGADRSTTFISGTQLTATVLTSDLGVAGPANVTVYNPPPGGGTSPASTFQVTSSPNPVPTISTLSPSSAAAGAPAFTLTVNGSGFVAGAVVRWNGSDRTTSFVSSGQVTAAISSADIASVGSATILVRNPAPGGGDSATLTFTINNPGPMATSVSPATVAAGGPAFTLTVNGSGFILASVVRWNGVDRPTTFVSPSQLTAAIQAADIASTGTAAITVFNGSPGGGLSGAISLPIQNPVPVISGLNPESVGAASGAFTLTVNGSHFVAGAIVRWNGQDRPTTFVTSTQLTASIPAGDLMQSASVPITVSNPAPGGGVSTPVTFTVGAPVLQVTNKLVIAPDAAEFTPRSRLTISASVGDLAPSSVSFIIKRASDNKFWNGATNSWQDASFQNGATADSQHVWHYRIPGIYRRLFVNTEIVVEARATAANLPYKAALEESFHVR
jgi:hypothetical protein